MSKLYARYGLFFLSYYKSLSTFMISETARSLGHAVTHLSIYSKQPLVLFRLNAQESCVPWAIGRSRPDAYSYCSCESIIAILLDHPPASQISIRHPTVPTIKSRHA
ncbi:hypothetical protein FRC02_005089 [Tulasnella sp. 418]|nr:hypothetical protein FRC02_005089 [Tulasnella sp. 418]